PFHPLVWPVVLLSQPGGEFTPSPQPLLFVALPQPGGCVQLLEPMPCELCAAEWVGIALEPAPCGPLASLPVEKSASVASASARCFTNDIRNPSSICVPTRMTAFCGENQILSLCVGLSALDHAGDKHYYIYAIQKRSTYQ